MMKAMGDYSKESFCESKSWSRAWSKSKSGSKSWSRSWSNYRIKLVAVGMAMYRARYMSWSRSRSSKNRWESRSGSRPGKL